MTLSRLLPAFCVRIFVRATFIAACSIVPASFCSSLWARNPALAPTPITFSEAATTADSLQVVFARQVFFGKSFPQERVYLHLDKPYYHLGDVLYYKIYATMTPGIMMDTLSQTLYVELLDASGTVLQSQKKKLSQGHGYGSMDMLSAYTPGVYRVRAFTSWMRNFSTEPLFEQVITLYGSLQKGLNWHLTSSVQEGPELDTLNLTLHLTDSLYHGIASPYEFTFEGKRISKVRGSMNTNENGQGRLSLLISKNRKEGLGQLSLIVGEDIQHKDVVLASKDLRAWYFPEGGDWVAGIRSRVAFKVTDEKGTGLPCTGVVRDSQGRVVAQFSASHRGMGAFWMTPQPGETYTGEITFEDILSGAEPQTILRTRTDTLPTALPSGYVMEVDGASEDSLIICVRNKGVRSGELMGIMIQNGARVVTRGHLRMRGDSSVLKVARSELPTGVSAVTLYRADGTAVSERLVFVNNHDALNIQIYATNQTFQPRGMIDLNLKVTDARGNPVEGAFSMSVTDATQVQDTSRYGENILTHLLLTSEIRGRVEDPGYYFEADTREKREALEMLLLTQGWRRYLWELAASDSLPRLEYPVDRGFYISGRILNITTRKPVSDQEVTLFIQHSQGKDFSVCTTNETGRFKFVTDYFGQAKVNIQTRTVNSKGKTNLIERAIEMDKTELSFSSDMEELSIFQEDGPAQSPAYNLQLAQAAIEDFQKAREEVRDYNMRLDSVARVISLEEVEVKTKSVWKPSAELKAMADTTIMMREALEGIRDMVNFNIDNIYDFLKYAYPEKFREYDGSVRYIGNRPILVLENTWPARILKSLSCYQKIEIIDKPGAALSYGALSESGPDADAVIVSLTLNPGAICRNIPIGVRSYRLPGYTNAREFFAPDYPQNTPATPDARSTLYWGPYVQTDSTGRATVRFFNSDQATRIGVNVQGVGSGGIGAAKTILFQKPEPLQANVD